MQPQENPIRSSAGPERTVFLGRVFAIIDLHLSDPYFSVEQLAHELGVGRRQLERTTRTLIASSPSELIRHLRLERAAELLGSSSVKVSDVSTVVGFKSHAHFSRVFRQAFGMSPTEHIRRSGPDESKMTLSHHKSFTPMI
jgi:transcriptional regulator GlxA family with amidase domain